MILPILALAAAGGLWAYFKRVDGAHAVYAPPAAIASPAVKKAVNATLKKAAASGKPITKRVAPTDRGAPPLDAAGRLGHTGILGTYFWGLPMNVIWMIEDSYVRFNSARDPLILLAAVDAVNKFPAFRNLAGMIHDDAVKSAYYKK